MTRVLVVVLTVALVSAAGARGTQDPPPFLRGETFPRDLAVLVRQIEPVYRRFPDEACVLYQVAALYARAGRPDRALAALRAMHATGAGLLPRLRDGFESLADNPEFIALRARIRREHPPVLNATPAFDLAEADLGPEGIAWSARTRTLYLGSVKRKIVAVRPGEAPRDFVAPATGGLGYLAGLRVDEARAELWAASWFQGQAPEGLVRGVFRFRLADGALVRAYPVEAEDDMVNDLAIAPDGAVYGTATNSGALMRIDPASGRIERFLERGTLPDPNGVAITPDGKALLVAGWYGVTRVDLATRVTRLLDKAPSMAIGCLDGLYVSAPGEVVGVQNCVHDSGRILRLRLDPAYTRVESLEVLESDNPLFEGLTTAAVVGRTLYFVANTQLRKATTPGTPAGAFNPLRVLALPLGDLAGR